MFHQFVIMAIVMCAGQQPYETCARFTSQPFEVTSPADYRTECQNTMTLMITDVLHRYPDHWNLRDVSCPIVPGQRL